MAGVGEPRAFRSDEARMRVLARTAGILGELEAAVRRELGADKIRTPHPGRHRARALRWLRLARRFGARLVPRSCHTDRHPGHPAGRRQVHLHFHGISAEVIAGILAERNRPDGPRV